MAHSKEVKRSLCCNDCIAVLGVQVWLAADEVQHEEEL